MKRDLPNLKLTANFSLYEFIEAQLPPEAVELNWQHINEMDWPRIEQLANFLQNLRNDMNQVWRAANGGREIGIQITSGFRCKAWELIRKRPGSSQHCTAAVDIQPTGCPPEMAAEILRYYHKKYKTGNGWFGGLAIKDPEYDKSGRILKVGFLHFDQRGYNARWQY